VTRAGLFRSALAGALLLVGSAAAMADTRDEVLTVYRGFAEAQNARDLDRIGAYFVDGPDFLWVSDGQSIWGRPDVLERMSGFQKAEVWHVVPDLDHARVVELDPDVAMLHMPLVLELGSAASPDRLRFLVSILFRNQQDGWKIASLLTTTQKPVAP
jgi:ketosteroid isomerase-like protein